MTDPDLHPATPNEPAETTASTRRPSPSGRFSGKLLALGAAAVVTVYAAGFERTKLAAQQYSDDGMAERRTPPPMPPRTADAATDVSADESSASLPDAAVLPAAEPTASETAAPESETVSVLEAEPAPVVAPAVVQTVAPKPSEAVKPAVANTLAQEAPKRLDSVVTPTPSPTIVGGAATATPPASAKEIEADRMLAERARALAEKAEDDKLAAEKAAKEKAAADKAAAEKAAVVAAKSEPKPKATSKKEASADDSRFKDGTYTGYATSRHGDIEAMVVIENGNIKSASINRCLTNYTCSWIDHLPKQVVDRQSPDVDYVSGATLSANAFYYAVFEALTKAR